MPNLPGSDSEVFFGDTEQELPNWRERTEDDSDDEDELSERDRAALIGVLGFDPAELYSDKIHESKDASGHEHAAEEKAAELYSKKGVQESQQVQEAFSGIDQLRASAARHARRRRSNESKDRPEGEA